MFLLLLFLLLLSFYTVGVNGYIYCTYQKLRTHTYSLTHPGVLMSNSPSSYTYNLHMHSQNFRFSMCFVKFTCRWMYTEKENALCGNKYTHISNSFVFSPKLNFCIFYSLLLRVFYSGVFSRSFLFFYRLKSHTQYTQYHAFHIK